MTEPDDGVLIALVAARRDQRAFSTLYERHTPAMYGLALRLAAGSESDAEDVVHDAWVRAVERLGGFEARSALRTWLCGFVVRRWREVRRRRERRPVAWTDDAAHPTGKPGGAMWAETHEREGAAHATQATTDVRLEETADRVDLERAVRRLADGYREVLVLHDIEGYTHEEIAALLGIEAGTSKSQLSRARHALRRTLSEPGGRP